MSERVENEDLKNLIVIGDRLLIKPTQMNEKTDSGIFLPPGVKEKERIYSGYVVKVGPGYPIPNADEDEDEDWKPSKDPIKYIPLQVKEGDLALFLQKNSYEIYFKKEKYFIVPQFAVLMIERDEDLFLF